MSQKIEITRIEKSKINDVDFNNFTFGSVRIPTFSPSLTRLNPPSFSVNPDTVVEANFDRLKSSLEHPDNSEATISVPTRPRKDAICKTSTNASKK